VARLGAGRNAAIPTARVHNTRRRSRWRPDSFRVKELLAALK
jgi:hypothetical protein